MRQEIAPIAVRPSTLSGISEQMVVSHYENNHGSAVRTLNAVEAIALLRTRYSRLILMQGWAGDGHKSTTA